MNVCDLLRFHEGTGPVRNGRYMAYKCSSGKVTVGTGRNLDDKGISEGERIFLLGNDVMDATEFLSSRLSVWPRLSDVRQAALIDAFHALGPDGFMAFKKTRAAVEAQRFDLAAFHLCDSHWMQELQSIARQSKRVPKQLRPERLAQMLRSGQWPTDVPEVA